MMLHHQDTGTMERLNGDQMGTGGELDGTKQEEEVDVRRVPSVRGFIMPWPIWKRCYNFFKDSFQHCLCRFNQPAVF